MVLTQSWHGREFGGSPAKREVEGVVEDAGDLRAVPPLATQEQRRQRRSHKVVELLLRFPVLADLAQHGRAVGRLGALDVELLTLRL